MDPQPWRRQDRGRLRADRRENVDEREPHRLPGIGSNSLLHGVQLAFQLRRDKGHLGKGHHVGT